MVWGGINVYRGYKAYKTLRLIQRIIKSSRRIKGKVGKTKSTTRGQAKLQERIDKTPEFKGMKKTQKAAEKEIERILKSNPEEVLDASGRKILRDLDTNRAIRLDLEGEFDTFLGADLYCK